MDLELVETARDPPAAWGRRVRMDFGSGENPLSLKELRARTRSSHRMMEIPKSLRSPRAHCQMTANDSEGLSAATRDRIWENSAGLRCARNQGRPQPEIAPESPSTPKPPPMEVVRDYVPVGLVNQPNVAADEGVMAHTLMVDVSRCRKRLGGHHTGALGTGGDISPGNGDRRSRLSASSSCEKFTKPMAVCTDPSRRVQAQGVSEARVSADGEHRRNLSGAERTPIDPFSPCMMMPLGTATIVRMRQ